MPISSGSASASRPPRVARAPRDTPINSPSFETGAGLSSPAVPLPFARSKRVLYHAPEGRRETQLDARATESVTELPGGVAASSERGPATPTAPPRRERER